MTNELKAHIELFKRGDYSFLELEPKQEKAMKILCSNGSIEELAFGGAAGGGKLVANNGVVLTPFGWKKGIDLKVGDLINNPDGTVQRLINITEERHLDKWTVVFSDGTETEVAKEHLWNAWKGRKGRKINNKRVFGEASAEVIQTDELKRWIERGYTPQIPVCKPQKFNRTSNEKNRIDPYLLGVLLGDGCVTKNVDITCHHSDFDHYKEQIPFEARYHGKRISFKGEVHKWLKEKLSLHNLLGTNSKTKFIPDSYKWGSVKDRFSLVQGLMDTDGYGCEGKNACYYTTISPQLSKGMAFLIRSLGGTVTVSKKKAGYRDKAGEYVQCNDSYELYIRIDDPDSLFRMKRKQFGSYGKNLVQKSVVDVRVEGKITGRCITVSNPNGLYITNDFIVTHNSWLGCTWLLFSSLAYPETKWFIARDKLTDLMKSTYKTFYKVCKHYDIPTDEFSFNGQYHYFKFKNGSEVDLVKLQYMPSDPDYDGVGSTEYTGGWIEEAAQVMKMAYIVMKSRTGRQFNDRYNLTKKLLITLNPSKGWPYQFFYKPWKAKQLPEDKSFIQSLVDDNSKIDSGYIESLEKLEDNAKKQRLRYGNWEYDGDESILIPYDSILSIWKNNHVRRHAGGTYITADIALQGSDKFVIAVWKGFVVIDLEVIDKCDAKEVERIIRKKAYEYNVPQYRIAYDSDGLGNYLRGYMELAKPFVNNSTPVKGNTESSEYKHFKEEYKHLKAQCYFRMASLINAGKMYIECDLGKYKDELIEELETVKNASYGTDEKLAVLKKDEIKELIGRSPDLADCLMMRMYFTLHNKLSDIRDIRFYAADLEKVA